MKNIRTEIDENEVANFTYVEAMNNMYNKRHWRLFYSACFLSKCTSLIANGFKSLPSLM